ncbi:sigma-70 family RNA polymerase sigma factor [Methylophilus sp. 3sh_L]|uniref:sigma-70 family RNA polymerase sigma factor n=1 Tax=Methylophilus sp. 3sh_L TaxID=3377114 RepID=UPI00398F1438
MLAKELIGHQAVESLYNDHHHWLKSWLRRQLYCNERAADLAHDTFVRVISARNASQIVEPRVYLATIARRLMVDYFRRATLERAYLDALSTMPEPIHISAEERAVMVETLCEIDAMLDALGEKTRQIFLMSQLDGMTYPEISVQMNLSVSAIKKYMARAIEHCLLFSLA